MSKSDEIATKTDQALLVLSDEDRVWLEATLEKYRILLDFLHEN